MNKKRDTTFDSQANLSVKNIPKEMDYSGFYTLFKEFGDIISCKLDVNHDGTNKGFGFVQYNNSESAQNAMKKLNEKDYKGSKLTLSVIVPKKPEDQVDAFTNLHIKGIPNEWTEKQLTDLFAEFGEIQSVAIKEDKSEQAFVKFKNADDAKKSIEALNAKKEINGKVIFV